MMDRPQEEQKTPATLSEAHAVLERMLSPQQLAEIDAMPSERNMAKYHFSLGLTIRNGWGLWTASPLAKHMQELGFTHADDMSSVILGTFWCKRHGQDFRLKERAAGYRRALGIEEEVTEEELNRVKKAKAALPNLMMGTQFEKRDVPMVRMPDRDAGCLRVALSCLSFVAESSLPSTYRGVRGWTTMSLPRREFTLTRWTENSTQFE